MLKTITRAREDLAFHPMSFRAIFIGAPGSGKGTLISKLLRDFPHIRAASTGDVLRHEIAANSLLGREVSVYMTRGELVPDNTMIKLVRKYLAERNLLEPNNANWILDGFPRTLGQAERLDQMLASHNSHLDAVVHLNVSEDEILARIQNRWIHESSGRVYNLVFNPPKIPGLDDITGEPLVHRSDDNAKIFTHRMEAFKHLTEPLIDYYNRRKIVHTIRGDSSNKLYQDLYKLVCNFL